VLKKKKLLANPLLGFAQMTCEYSDDLARLLRHAHSGLPTFQNLSYQEVSDRARERESARARERECERARERARARERTESFLFEE
jgi:hypothetical protein